MSFSKRARCGGVALVLGGLLLAGCGQGAGASSAGSAPQSQAIAAQSTGDEGFLALLAEYRSLTWSTDAARKRALIVRMIATHSDGVVDALLADFRGLSWIKDHAAKLALLSGMRDLTAADQLAAATADAPMAAQGLIASLRHWHPSLGALGRMAQGLRAELAATPEEDKPRVQAVLRNITIIAPNSSR